MQHHQHRQQAAAGASRLGLPAMIVFCSAMKRACVCRLLSASRKRSSPAAHRVSTRWITASLLEITSCARGRQHASSSSANPLRPSTLLSGANSFVWRYKPAARVRLSTAAWRT